MKHTEQKYMIELKEFENSNIDEIDLRISLIGNDRNKLRESASRLYKKVFGLNKKENEWRIIIRY